MSIHKLFKKLFLITTFIFIFAFLSISFNGNKVNAESVSTSVTISAQVYACELVVQFNRGKGVENLNLQTSYLLSIKDRENNKIYSLVGETDQNGYSYQDLCSNEIYIMNNKADVYIEAFNGFRKKINNKEIFLYARSTLNIIIDKEDFKVLQDASDNSEVITTSSEFLFDLPNIDSYLNELLSYSAFISKLILLASISIGVSYGSIYISKVFKSLLKEYIYAVKYIYRYITLEHIKNVYS